MGGWVGGLVGDVGVEQCTYPKSQDHRGGSALLVNKLHKN